MYSKTISIAILAVVASGCASIVSGTSQSMFIETPQLTGASCKLTDSKSGEWFLPSTPGSATVQKGNGPMNITWEKEGYETTTINVEESFAGATLGNIILGGGIGILVDAASGAAQIYPDNVQVWMKPTEWKSKAEETAWHSEKQAYEEQLAEKNKPQEAQ